MAPRQDQDSSEKSSLVENGKSANRNRSMEVGSYQSQTSSLSEKHHHSHHSKKPFCNSLTKFHAVLIFSLLSVLIIKFARKDAVTKPEILLVATGPYRLVEAQEGQRFFDSYEFYDGPDSLGSAGYNTYVGKAVAKTLEIASVRKDLDPVSTKEEEFVYMSSSPNDEKGLRDSVRLEGKRRFERGLFLLDVRHMPDGCGVWPAFWLTDEANWPRNGEVDILEGVNGQTVAKTALHTSDQCDMYAHVAPYDKTGEWEWVTGIPETFTGEPDFKTAKAADNCWVMAQHQWANEGCTAVHDRNNTLGKPVNDNGGGVYALEWDPENRYIKSWVFSPRSDMPENLIQSIDTAGLEDKSQKVMPDPSTWGLPYAYFAIGKDTGCSADHFKNMRIVFNLAFCGNVSGNRFFRECPKESKEFNVTNDPVLTCDAYIKSNPEALKEAYWKIKGVYVYEREFETPEKTDKGSQSQEE
eukprot:CAMPEP_0171375102 /NCGR_PEP_ID=MMETSP0879-20121228/16021_1 /TAXON_ID=67004 /ORGANISM="Thalassiosira weissflogii, Strain CCMP1336" /LENGTH=467 /DNA_ID=CAMNT_0011884583 /DNA_START=93 /DNA_END=1496 /DNA_ORIENTATION=-